jgi:hypothetical protein
MHSAFACLCLLAFDSCSFVTASGSRPAASASDAYEQRLLEVVDRTVGPATDKFPRYTGASVHFSFRVDPVGQPSRVRAVAERASDRPIAQVVAEGIRAAHFPPPPPQLMIQQGASLVRR